MILQFIDGLRGDVHVRFEEGTWAAWLYDLLKPHVTKVVVCDPRRNALLQEGNQNDRVDARKLAELLPSAGAFWKRRLKTPSRPSKPGTARLERRERQARHEPGTRTAEFTLQRQQILT